MNFHGRVYAVSFHRRNQFRFPGNGRVSGGVDGHAGRSVAEALLCDKRSQRESGKQDSGNQAPPAHLLPTEQSIIATVEGTVGTNPGDFLDLLRDPEHDKRATAIPAAREERE